METISRKTPFIVIESSGAAPVVDIPAERLEAAAAQAAETARADFSDAMELAITGVVLSGAVLFGANLLRFGAPPCALRDDAVGCLFALAVCGGLATAAVAINGLWHLLSRSAPGRG